MPLNIVEVALPAGVYKNGTPYSARGRWGDCDHVRWLNGAMRPIGGYSPLTLASGVPMASLVADPAVETVRDMITWVADGIGSVTVIGSNLALYYMAPDNAVTNITPDGYTGGSNHPVANQGYGAGLYGRGAYGTARSGGNPTVIPAIRWSMSTWGSDVIVMPFSDGRMFSYKAGDAKAVVIPNAPANSRSVVVTPQRFVMAVAADRTVTWSDRENRDVWTPSVNNEAGSILLEGSGEALAITRILDQVIVLTTADAFVGQYTGPPYVYGFRKVGKDVGIISQNAYATTDRFTVWAGQRGFWMYDGTVKPLPSDVSDFFYYDRNATMDSKITTTVIPEFSEVWWFYQSKGSTEVDSYIAFNYLTNHWLVGKLARTAAVGGFGGRNPIMVDDLGIVWRHEVAGEAVAAFAETGPLELGAGAGNLAVRNILPDTSTFGTIEFTLKGRAMPTEPEYPYGPYPYNNQIATRAMGREIRMRIDGIANDWEVGTVRLDVTKGGAR